MRINHNIAALNTYNKLSSNQATTAKSLEKLSSGLRINKAGDDAAGLAISEKMRGQIRGLDQASRNANDGISLIQTAEGALNETHSILQRMRELAVQASNDTNTENDRLEIQKEIDQLSTEVTRIADNTEFNTKTLLNGELSIKTTGALTNTVNASSVKLTKATEAVDGKKFEVSQQSTYAGTGATDVFEDITFTISDAADAVITEDVTFTKAELDAGTYSKEVTVGTSTFKIDLDADKVAALTATTYTVANAAATTADELTIEDKSMVFHIGANDTQNTSLSISNMDAESLGVHELDLKEQTTADAAIKTIDTAISTVSSQRAALGAMQNRLEHTINNLGTTSENLTASESRIRDVDMAQEMMQFTKNNILSQAAQAMLAQANQQPQGVLQLLQ